MKNLNKPTPAKWAKLGMAFLSVSSFISGYGVAVDNDIIAYVGLSTGILGTFITNLFAEK